mgnify:CR=1 FL=1|jgi:hypothetical protein
MGMKTKTKRNPIFIDEKYTGPEPEWTGKEKLTDSELKIELLKAFQYYNYFYSNKDFRAEVNDYLKKSGKLTKEELRIYKASKECWTPVQVGALIRMLDRGAPLRANQIDYIFDKVRNAMGTVTKSDMANADFEEQADAADAANKVKAKPSLFETIQSKLTEQAQALGGEIEGQIDMVLLGQKPDLNVYKWLNENQVSQPVANKIKFFFQAFWSDIKEAKASEDEQLQEAYSNIDKKKYKAFETFFEGMFADFDSYNKSKKAERKPRKKKAVSADKLVAKLKYAKDFKELKLTSIRPTEIVGAEVLWVYNTKTKKLGKYCAEFGAQLSVKGSTILNYDEGQSLSKTLRKPEQKLPELLKAGKVPLRKFLEDIKATAIKLTGRINADTILLRVT